MAKELETVVKLQVPAGSANPAPPVGPALGQHGLNIQDFCKQFNDKTKDVEKAQRIARQLRSGMVEINGVSFADGSPFGGYKQSGNGREGGKWGIEEFLEVKSISGWK